MLGTLPDTVRSQRRIFDHVYHTRAGHIAGLDDRVCVRAQYHAFSRLRRRPTVLRRSFVGQDRGGDRSKCHER